MACESSVIEARMTSAHICCRFRWVCCQLAHLRRCLSARIRHALDELPETLDETYERGLRDIDNANWKHAHRLLQCVAVASRPLRVEELAQILGFDFVAGSIPIFHDGFLLYDPVDAVLSATSSLLSIVDFDGSPVIQFSHFSVKEFLTSSRLAESSDIIIRRNYISIPRAHTIAAQACLGMLLHLDRSITRGDLGQFPLVEYAAEHCVDHARFNNVSQEVEDGMKQLFDPSKRHFRIWVWIHDPGDLYWRREKRGERPSQPCGTPLHYAALCGLDTIVKFLITEHSQDVDCRGFNHQSTALHLASSRGHVEVASVLLDHGADGEARDKRKSTSLHLASSGGHAELVRVLLNRGADTTARDELNLTPAVLALRSGHEVTKVFAEFDVGSITNGTNPLTRLNQALFEGNTDLTRDLLENGTDLPGHANGWFNSLKVATLGGNAEAIRALLEHGVDATAKDDNDWTLLHFASIGGRVEVVRTLLEYGVDVTAQQKDGLTPLHTASFGGHVEVARLLLRHGADPTVQDKDGWTPLYFASNQGYVEFARLLLEHGVDATAQNEEGLSALHMASVGGHAETARILLEFGADPTAQNQDRWTPLHTAAVGGPVELSRVLLEHGADVTALTNNGWTPLHVAAAKGHVELARLFLDHGADMTARDDRNLTSLHIAVATGHVEVANLLIERGANASHGISKTDDGRSPLNMASREEDEDIARPHLEHETDAMAQGSQVEKWGNCITQ